MALQRSHGTSSLLNAVRKAEDQRLMVKDARVPGKVAADGQRLTRAALRNLSNQSNVVQQKPAPLKAVKSVNEPAKLKKSQAIKKEAKPLVQTETQRVTLVSAPVNQHEQVQNVDQVCEVCPSAQSSVESVVSSSVDIVLTTVDAVGSTVDNLPTTHVESNAAVNNEAECMDMSCASENCIEEAFSKEMWKLNINDIDQDDTNNPQLISEYINDIYDYMRDLELKFHVRPKCLSNQVEINGRMRGILIDWLVQVHQRFQLLQETLYLTIAILDRYLQVESVAKGKLQLVGVTCMWIACKYEEMYAPEVADFVYITDNAYKACQMRQMECQILKTLDFEIGRPLPIHFLRRNSKAADADATIHTLAKYLMELTIVDYDMVQLRPSEVAAAALCLSLKLINQSQWTPTLVYYSRYTEAQLMPIIRKMGDLVLTAGTGRLTAIKAKYQSSKLMRISKSPLLDCELITELSASHHLAVKTAAS